MTNDLTQMLADSVRLLAASAPAQERYLKELGSWPSLDELALELDVILPAAPTASRSLSNTLRALDKKLDSMSGSDNAVLWRAEALTGPDWAEVRTLARTAWAEMQREAST